VEVAVEAEPDDWSVVAAEVAGMVGGAAVSTVTVWVDVAVRPALSVATADVNVRSNFSVNC
jgi:hypothetical protein